MTKYLGESVKASTMQGLIMEKINQNKENSLLKNTNSACNNIVVTHVSLLYSFGWDLNVLRNIERLREVGIMSPMVRPHPSLNIRVSKGMKSTLRNK